MSAPHRAPSASKSPPPAASGRAPHAQWRQLLLFGLLALGVAAALHHVASSRAAGFASVAEVGPMPDECAVRYRHARSASDTAIIDAIVLGNARQPSTALSCGIYRTHALEPGTGAVELRRP